jgi:uncharacterized membrane protein YoaK (UPF0700 family)
VWEVPIKDARRTPIPVIAALLAACSGSVDTLAFFGLGQAFAGIVTGNLVTAGYGLATGDAVLVWPTATAVAGCILGEAVWAVLLRRDSRYAVPLLILEHLLLACVLVAWLIADARPRGILTLAMLALLSASLGGQSIWALRIHQTTTYFTGMLTTAISAAADGSWARVVVGGRQLCALLTGAALAGVALHELRPAAAALPIVFLSAATTLQVHLMRKGATA